MYETIVACLSVPSGKYGHTQFGSWGYKVGWQLWRENANCTDTELGSGYAYLPNPANLGYHTWTSTSP